MTPRYVKTVSPVLALALVSTTLCAQAPAASWRDDVLCGSKLPAFESTEVRQCHAEAYCSSIDPQTRVCACPDQTEKVQLTVEYRGKVVKTWATDVTPVSFGPKALRIDEFGLNQKGDKQALFSVMQGQSNGMAAQSWSIWSIANGQVSDPVQAEDYGLISFATRPKGSQRCQLLVSNWRPGPRGGLFAVGRWHDVREGQFVPGKERPAITRRYLYRFEKQRDESRLTELPLRWYAHPDAHPVP